MKVIYWLLVDLYSEEVTEWAAHLSMILVVLSNVTADQLILRTIVHVLLRPFYPNSCHVVHSS